MVKNGGPVKADGDEAGRLSKCSYCPAMVRWTKTASAHEGAEGKSMPLDPELVWVRLPAHGEDGLARQEQVILAWDQGLHKKGGSIRGVRCHKDDKGALAGRIPHWATCAGKLQARADKDAKVAAQEEHPLQQAPQEEAPKKNTLSNNPPRRSAQEEVFAELMRPMLGQAAQEIAIAQEARAELVAVLWDALEAELDARGCVWTSTPRGLVITRETKPEAGGPAALQIGRLCAALRLAQGLEAGQWLARGEVRP